MEKSEIHITKESLKCFNDLLFKTKRYNYNLYCIAVISLYIFIHLLYKYRQLRIESNQPRNILGVSKI